MDCLTSRRSRPLRRMCLSLLAVGVVLLPQGAQAERRGVVVFCDRTLVPVMRQLARRFGTSPVGVFATSPPLMVAQIAHGAQNDVLVTSEPVLDEAARQGLIQPHTRIGHWRNSLVVAAPAGAGLVGGDLAGVLTGRTVAATDPTTMAAFDGQALLRRLAVPMDHVLGAANIDEVRFLLDSGVAQLGLVYRTDVQADPALAVVAVVPDAAETSYGAALSTVANSSNAQALLDFLQSPMAVAIWRNAGLDVR